MQAKFDLAVLKLKMSGFTIGTFVLIICLLGAPLSVINALAELGYKVVCSTGEAEILWTLQREV